MLDARQIAVDGVGFGARPMALLGFVPASVVDDVVGCAHAFTLAIHLATAGVVVTDCAEATATERHMVSVDDAELALADIGSEELQECSISSALRHTASISVEEC
jgi:hypothetical protein